MSPGGGRRTLRAMCRAEQTSSAGMLGAQAQPTILRVFWLKDDSLDNLDDLPPPDVLQQEIIEHLEAALSAFRDVAAGRPAFEPH